MHSFGQQPHILKNIVFFILHNATNWFKTFLPCTLIIASHIHDWTTNWITNIHNSFHGCRSGQTLYTVSICLVHFTPTLQPSFSFHPQPLETICHRSLSHTIIHLTSSQLTLVSFACIKWQIKDEETVNSKKNHSGSLNTQLQWGYIHPYTPEHTPPPPQPSESRA